jgi:hypothetical protein
MSETLPRVEQAFSQLVQDVLGGSLSAGSKLKIATEGVRVFE